MLAVGVSPAAKRACGIKPQKWKKVSITVSDTGAGLDPTLLPRIFEPFFTTKAQGLGIGLSIAHSIVEMHRGQLSVEPGPARGCTFAFTLPAVPEDSAVPGWSGSSRRRESPDT